MPVVLARIDDRLVHGQVAVGWSRATNADLLVVANDDAAADPLQQSLMQLATPAGLTLRVLSVQGAGAADAKGEFDAARSLLLFSTPSDALLYREAGGRLTSLNVGGMRQGAGKRCVKEAVCLSDQDCQDLLTLADAGIELECRIVPTDRRTDLVALLKGSAGA